MLLKIYILFVDGKPVDLTFNRRTAECWCDMKKDVREFPLTSAHGVPFIKA